MINSALEYLKLLILRIFDQYYTWKFMLLNQTSTDMPKIETPSLFWYSVKMLFALFVVLGIILGFAYILRKLGTKTMVTGSQEIVSVLEMVPILNKWYVVLLKVGTKFYLVGLTENSMNLIAELSREDIEERKFETTIKKIVEEIE